MKKMILFCLFCLSLGWATSCDELDKEMTNGGPYPVEPPNLPMFQFDEQGVPYRWETQTLSEELQQDVLKHAIGYGWRWMQTNEIQSDGYVKSEDFYKEIIGVSPSSYYLVSNDRLVRYFYSDAVHANAFLGQAFTMDLTKGSIYSNTSSTVSPWSLFFRVWGVWQLDGRWFMTTIEPLCTRNDGSGVYKTVWGCSQYVRMSPAELKQMQETYVFDYSQKQ